jgi:hypothetical protein
MSLVEKLEALVTGEAETVALTGPEFLELATWPDDSVNEWISALGDDFRRIIIHARYAAQTPALWEDMMIYLTRAHDRMIMSAVLQGFI